MILTAFWPVLLGAYAIGLLVASSVGMCPYSEGREEVQALPPGYVCVTEDDWGLDGDGHEKLWESGTVVGPGIGTVLLQVFLVVAPVLGWIASTSDRELRRQIAEIWVFAGIGLVPLGGLAAIIGAPGLAAVFVVLGTLLLVVGRTQVVGSRPTAVDSAGRNE